MRAGDVMENVTGTVGGGERRRSIEWLESGMRLSGEMIFGGIIVIREKEEVRVIGNRCLRGNCRD